LTILLFRQNLLKSLVKYKTNPRGLILLGVCVANSKIKRVAFYHPSLNCFFTTVICQITIDKRRFNVAYRNGIRCFNGVYQISNGPG